MDLALTINAWIDEEIIFAQQLGASQVFASVDPDWGDAPGWDAQSMAKLANRVEKSGLILAGLHAVSLPATDPIAWAAGLVENAGTAEIGLLSLSAGLFSRGSLIQKTFAAALPSLADAAGRAGIRLAIPAAGLFKGHSGAKVQAGLLRGLPPSTGLDAAPAVLQNWFALPESSTRQSILDKLFLVSLENEALGGLQPGSGLDGLPSLCWRLRQANYSGLIRLGRPAHWKGDTREAHHALAFSTGYLRAVFQAFQRV